MAEEEKENLPPIPKTAAFNPVVTVMLLLNLLALSGVGYLQFRAYQREKAQVSVQDIVKAQMQEMGLIKDVAEGSAKGGPKVTQGLLLQLDRFSTNLAQGDGPRRYISTQLVLKFSDHSKEEEFQSRKPQIRDTIISILNAKRPEDLLKVEGKKYLKEEMKTAINSFLIDGTIEDVYYVSFQIN